MSFRKAVDRAINAVIFSLIITVILVAYHLIKGDEISFVFWLFSFPIYFIISFALASFFPGWSPFFRKKWFEK